MEFDNFKYEYHLFAWGGFYNDRYREIHHKEEGNYWFDTKEERQKYIDELREIEKNLDGKVLMITLSEGFCCRIKTVLHRVVECDGLYCYTKNELGYNFPIDVAQYTLAYKWRVGFNDYPLGEDYDYSKARVIQEWITGAIQEFKE